MYGGLHSTVDQHEPWYSRTEMADRPSAERRGSTLTLQPSGASLQIPIDWVEWYSEFGNNFHLSQEELDAVARGAGEWDTEYASVCNAALPFDRCAAHAGGEGWGAESVSYGDLQMRVYQLHEPIDLAERNILVRATSDARRLTLRTPEVLRTREGNWQRIVISFPRFYVDYGGIANVDFRSRQFGAETFVFVFMYSDYREQNTTIEAILDSFSHP
jgi:hypothetical protein